MRIILVFVLLLLATLNVSCSDDTATMNVSGAVLSGANGDPIAGAKIYVETGYTGYTGDYDVFHVTATASGTTSSEGAFQVTLEVEEKEDHDEVHLRASAEGYGNYSADLPFADVDNVIITLTPQSP